jgi:hypothetical protein
MATVAWWALLVCLPLIAAVSLVLAVIKQRTRPAWLFALALIAPLGTVALAVWASAARDWNLAYPAAILWMLAAAVALTLAMIGTRRGWRASQSLMLLGTIMPAVALVPLLLFAGVFLGGGAVN